MKTTKLCSTIILSTTFTWSNFIYAESIPELSFHSIPPEAMQAIDTVNQSLANRFIPIFDGRALSAGIGALAGVFVYNLLPHTIIVNAAGTTVMSAAATNQLPMMTSAVIGALIADYLYRQNDSMPISISEFP